MHYSYLIPDWFFGFDVAMELLFALVTIAISVVSLKVYNITKEKNTKLFSIAFALIGISYFIWASANLWLVKAASEGFREISINDFIVFDTITAYAFMILFTLGLVFIVYITSGMKGTKSFSLILGLSLMVIAASHYKLVTFRILSVFLLLFVVMRYVSEFAQKKTKGSLAVLLSFTLLLLGSADFIFSPLYYQTYVIGHFLELSAYIILLAVLIKTLRK